MTAALCITGDGRPQHWRGFCATCCVDMGVMWRLRVRRGRDNVKRRVVAMLAERRASCKTLGGGRK